MFMMSIVLQVREINSTLIQNRVDNYTFYLHVTHYTHTYKSLFSNKPQALNFQQGRSKYMFLSVFINSCIHTVYHVLPWDCQHKTSKHLVMASNCMKTELMTWRKKMCRDFGLFFRLSFYKHDIYEMGSKYKWGSLCILPTNVKRPSMITTLLPD